MKFRGNIVLGIRYRVLGFHDCSLEGIQNFMASVLIRMITEFEKL